MTTASIIQELSAAAEHRGSAAARRADGSYFTADDVSAWLARRALDAYMHEADDGSTTEELRARLTAVRVLDPACGAGAFLVAAWNELQRWQALLDDRDRGTPDSPRVAASQLHGVDIDAGAIAAATEIIDAVAGPGACFVQGDALDVLRGLGTFELVLGNPPYVRAPSGAAPARIASIEAGNLAAWIVERALSACAPGGRIAMVLPISAASSPKWGAFRAVWDAHCTTVHAAHFDTIPSTLFPGVVQRLTLLEGRIGGGPASWSTTRYHRWLRSERDGLLERVHHVAIDRAPSTHEPLPKLGSALEVELWDALHVHPPIGRWFVRDERANVVHYKRRWSYFLLFADFVPPIWDEHGNERLPSELQSLGIDRRVDARAVVAVFSSTLFWWWFSVRTDNRNVNRGDIAVFPMPEIGGDDIDVLASLGAELMEALRACGEVRTCTYRSVGTIRNTYYRQAETRPVLDRIDRELARVFCMSAAQLDVVLGYERRFRS